MSEGSAPAGISTPATTIHEVKIDEEKQKRIQKFTRVANVVGLPVLLATVTVEVCAELWLLPPLFRWFFSCPWLTFQPLAGWYPLRAFVIPCLGILFLGAIAFPLLFVLGYALPRRHKLQQFTLSAWLRSWARLVWRWEINTCLFVQVFYLLFLTQPNLWWLWTALLLTLVYALRTYLTPLYAYRKLKRIPLTDERLINLLSQLCETHRVQIHHFYQLASKKPGKLIRANAFLAGWGKTSSILLTSGLLKYLQPAEIEVMVAHELGHHVHRHLIQRQIVNLVLWLGEFLGYFLSWRLLVWVITSSSFPYQNATKIAILVTCLCCAIRATGFLLKRKLRRHNEFQADEFALRATGNLVLFKNAMTRLGNLQNHPFKLTPLQEAIRTHPSMLRRLQRAEKVAASMSG